MEKYISQLLNDIAHMVSQQQDSLPERWKDVDMENENELEDMSYIEEHLYGQKQELQKIVGLQKEALPPSNRLNNLQISKLLNALESLLKYHHFKPAYPCELDDRTKYELLYNEWTNDHVKVIAGFVNIEFCNSTEENCPIPGKCKVCEEFRNEEEAYNGNEPSENILKGDLLPTKEEVENFMTQQNSRRVQDTIENLKPSKENIKGIFNYCDRWCEKCSFTDRCTNFQFEKELGIFEDSTDRESMAEDLTAILNSTLSFLKSKIERMDIDLPMIDISKDHKILKETDHELVSLAKNYSISLTKWLKTNFDNLADLSAKLWNSSQEDFNELSDHLEIIGWYMTMIPLKLDKALNTKDNFGDTEFYKLDRNATGKLVFLCIEHSITSFSFLFSKLPKKQDELLDFLTLLSKIKEGLLKELPGAKEFVRPGLDE